MNNETKKKVLVLLGSPRKKGNSTILAQEIAKGAESVGARVETLYINGMDIKACQACWTCQKEDSKGCAIDDDMQAIYPKLVEADSWVIASPVHWFKHVNPDQAVAGPLFCSAKIWRKSFSKKNRYCHELWRHRPVHFRRY